MRRKFSAKKAISAIILALAIAVMFILLNMFASGKFLTLSNLKAVLINASVSLFVAWAFTFVFASGIIDLSLGAVIVLAANVAGTMGNANGYIGLVAGGVLTAVVLVTLNFTIYQLSRIPSWIAGLGMTMVYEAAASVYARNRLQSGLRVVVLDSGLRALGRDPWVFVVMLAGLLLAYFLYNRTTIGLNIRAMGSNQNVARIMGVSIGKTVILSGLLAGIFVGLAAVVRESFAGTVNAVTGLSSLTTTFQPLAAVLLAQAMQKYVNISVATVIGSVFIMAVFNVLTLMGVASGTWQETILGLSVIVFGIAAQKRMTGVIK
jgi:ribose transport system permease protein